MLRLSSLFVVLLAVFSTLFSTVSVHAQTPTVVMEDLEKLTVASNDLQITCAGISPFNIIFRGPSISRSLIVIVTSFGSVTEQITVVDPKPFPDILAVQIVVILNKLVVIHQNLLATIIGKHGLLAQFRFTGPVRLALVALEQAIDTFVVALIELIPTRRSDCDQAKAKLDASVKACIKAYS